MKNNTSTAFRKNTSNEGGKRKVNLFWTAKNLQLFTLFSIELKNFKVNSSTSVFFRSRKDLEQFRFPLCYPLSQIDLKLLIDCQATARTITNTNRKENSLQFRKMFEKIAFKVQNFVFTSKCTFNCSDFLTVGQTKISSTCQLTFLDGAQPRYFNSRLVSF